MSGRAVDWLARRVSSLRSERRLSQADLARASGLEPEDVEAIEEVAAAAGLDREQLEQIETDQHRPDLAVMRALAVVLGKSVAELLGKG